MSIKTDHSNSCKIWKIKVKKNHDDSKLNENVIAPDLTLNISETNNYYDLDVKYNTKHLISYMDKFLRTCFVAETKYNINMSTIMRIYGFKFATKEITESMAAFSHTSYHLNKILYDRDVLCIVVADGKSPKTGIIFSLKTNWSVVSIDPMMEMEYVENKLMDNLVCYKDLVENKLDDILEEYKYVKQVVLINVHSHANTNKIWIEVTEKRNSKGIFCLSIPCCPGYTHLVKNIEPVYRGIDNGIASQKNEIYLWKYD